MRHRNRILLTYIALTLAFLDSARGEDDVIVKMTDCEATREFSLYLEAGILVKSSKQLVKTGRIEIAGETFEIFLPRDDGGYSAKPRPDRKTEMIWYTSSYLAVDQNHDDKLEGWESYLAELPLRIGDSMFDVVQIAVDGSSMTLRPSNKALQGAVIGRQAPQFEFTTIDGKKVDRDSSKGRVLLIDCWAPV